MLKLLGTRLSLGAGCSDLVGAAISSGSRVKVMELANAVHMKNPWHGHALDRQHLQACPADSTQRKSEWLSTGLCVQ